ncbi:MAG: pyruvate dehydrogenase [Planctomycetes bacterium GWF2_50_10]|nr:MAG: pyruvate dehydrogenase [Planctomycetes bacterium GWF2_50_10]
MPVITFREALGQAINEEMARDDRVFLIGEEVALYNGAYKVSRGLHEKYSTRRVIDTPIVEESFTGIGIGAAMAGLRPIVEWMTMNFSIQALDQTINNAAKMRYMSGGQFTLPIVFRGPNGPAEWLSAQHSQSLASIYTQIPGLKVVCPATPYDGKGLLKSAIRDDNPVIFLEAELAYGWQGEVPEDEYLIPIGQADIKRPGSQITLITFGKIVKLVLSAAAELEKLGIDAEVIDLRTLRPLDEQALINSVNKTRRAVVIDEAPPICSVGSHVAWLISNRCFDILDAQVELVSSEDIPMPYNHRLELAAQPSIEKILTAAKRTLYI